MMLSKVIAGAVLLGALSGSAYAAQNGPTLQDRQQAACAKDVDRLCPGLVPDVDKVTACMKSKRSQVSTECAAMYDKQ